MSAKSRSAPAQKSGLEHFLREVWKGHGAAANFLAPLSWVYRLLAFCRRLAYATGIKRIQKVDALVLVVGNVVAGGAGKTPTVISVVKHLQARGLNVGVVSRGYGRKSNATVEVTATSSAQDVGDEPALVRRSTGVPVVVGAKRVHAVQTLLAHHPETQIVVCDDGLQHYPLYRDLEICVFDNRGLGNACLLPAGPLRESWPRVALTQAGQSNDRLLVLHTGNQPALAGYRATRSLASHGLLSNGSRVALNRLPIDGDKPLLAVAGISQPQNFFDMLGAIGVPLAGTLHLPDHYDFNSDLRIPHKGYRLICTEKDAEKLWQVAPESIAIPLVQTAEPAFWTALDAQIDACFSERP